MISHYPLYDTALMQNAAGVRTLFAEPEGSTATKQSEDTNMRIGGQFASKSSFEIKKIGAFVDEALARADVDALWYENYLKVLIDNKNVLQIPLRLCAMKNAFGGVLELASAADEVLVGLDGDGFDLRVPIIVKGGVQFKVEVHQITALSTTDVPLKVILDGLYDDGN